MSDYSYIAQGNSPNFFSAIVQGGRAAREAKTDRLRQNALSEATETEKVRRNALLRDQDEADRTEQARQLYPVISQALQATDPAQRRSILGKAPQIMGAGFDDEDKRIIDEMVAADDAGLDEFLRAVNLSIEQRLGAKGKDAYDDFAQIPGAAEGVIGQRSRSTGKYENIQTPKTTTENDPEAFGEFEQVPGLPAGTMGQRSSKGGKFVNIQKPDTGEGEGGALKAADENFIGSSVASMFDGIYDIATGAFQIKDDANRRKAQGIKALATKMFSDGGFTRSQAVSAAAQRYGINIPEAPEQGAGGQGGGRTLQDYLQNRFGPR